MAKRHIEFYGSSVNSFGINLRAPEGDTTSPMVYGEKGQMLLHGIAKKFVSKAESLRDDPRYIPEGRNDALAKTAAECLKELRAGIKRFIEPLVGKYKNFDSTNLPALRRTIESNESVRRMEIRQFLAAQDGTKRREIFDGAVAELDDEILGCFFERTDLYQLLGKEIIDRGRKQYLQRKAPELLQAQIAGSVLTYNALKVTEDLGMFANTEDTKELLNELPTKLDWSFEPNNDFQIIESNQMSSVLPSPSMEPRSDSQLKEDLRNTEKVPV